MDLLYCITPEDSDDEFSMPKFISVERSKVNHNTDLEHLLDEKFWDFRFPNFYSTEEKAKHAWISYLRDRIEHLQDLVSIKKAEVKNLSEDLSKLKLLLDKTK